MIVFLLYRWLSIGMPIKSHEYLELECPWVGKSTGITWTSVDPEDSSSPNGFFDGNQT